MGRGKFKGKPTGRRMFSTPEEMSAGNSSARPPTFKKEEVKEEEDSDQDQDQEKQEAKKKKGVQGIIDIVNPNLVKPKSVKARNIDTDQRTTTELSRREREEIEKQKAHERYMRLQEEGKTDQAKKDLERLVLIRQQRSDAAKKRQEEKSNQKLKKVDLLK